MPKRNRRPQTQKDRATERVRAIQDLRRSNAAGPIPSRARYDRNSLRKNDQRGRWDD